MLKKKIFFSFVIFFLIMTILYIVFVVVTKKVSNKTVLHGNSEYTKYPNSIIHIKDNLENTKYFELDFQITKDNRLICYHGDNNLINSNFNSTFIKNLIFLEKKCFDNELIDFLKLHPDIYIITDFKINNIKGLKEIKKRFKTQLHQFIPQIYFYEEYDVVKKLGYKEIIFSTYKIPNVDNKEIFTMANKMELLAIAVDPARLRKNFYKDKINNINSNFIYVFTVNSWARLLQYKILYGANDIYTDKLFMKKKLY